MNNLYFFGSYVVLKALNRHLISLKQIKLFSKVKNICKSPERFQNYDIPTGFVVADERERIHFVV